MEHLEDLDVFAALSDGVNLSLQLWIDVQALDVVVDSQERVLGRLDFLTTLVLDWLAAIAVILKTEPVAYLEQIAEECSLDLLRLIEEVE